MHLIDEIEISYFRSFYKFKIRQLSDLNIIFGKNDCGKSNVVRALNLFFSGRPEHDQPFEFPIDFSEHRSAEASESEDVRKFLYVKVTFNTPPSYQRSLGNQFYVKRQWTVSRGQDYHEEISNSIPNNRRHIATRFLNKIKFIYVPAIKDIRIFEMLLGSIYDTLSNSDSFSRAIEGFSGNIQNLTSELFQMLPVEVSKSTKIGAPTRLAQLFQTLDFETIAEGETSPKSLTRQRGDGVKVRHIPELLNFISENDRFEYHIWGFEEPENSLDFAASQSEAKRLLALAKGDRLQMFITTHSPSFYLLDDISVSKFYVSKNNDGISNVLQGRELEKFDAHFAIDEGFYLPAVAEAVKKIAEVEDRAKSAEAMVGTLKQELRDITVPVVLTEGRTDVKILNKAWEKLDGEDPPFSIRSCETGAEIARGGNGGAQNLAIRLRGIAADHPHTVIGLFDYDSEGIKAFDLDKNFEEIKIGKFKIKRGKNGKAYAACLPAPQFRKECEDYQNLPIEFIFKDQHLLAEVDGRRLKLQTKKMSTVVGTRRLERELDDKTHFKDIKGGKTDFASFVVPTLESDAFEGFNQVFEMIDGIITYSEMFD